MTEPESATSDREVSLIRGGPFYRVQQAFHLIGPDKWNHGRRLTSAIAVGWVPLILITILTNPEGLVSLLRDYRVYARLLIAVPVLILGQLLMEIRFRMVVKHITDADLLAPPDLARMDGTISTLLRLRNSVFPELAVVLALVIHSVTSYGGLIDATPWLAHAVGPELRLTPAGWYAVIVSVTIFQFLLGLGLWKWLLWTLFAFKLSRLNLKLVATHPDDHGGLGFLALMPMAFAPIAFAAAAVIGATWRHEIIQQGVSVMNFKVPALILAAIIVIVALGPLVFFVPRLAALRRKGMLEYGVLGQMHSADFDEKWIHQRTSHKAEFLTATEISTLSNFGRSYEKLVHLKPFPADREVLIALAISVVVPMLPVILAVVPLAVVLKGLLKALG